MEINFKVYELNGVTLPLDLDDLNVEGRIVAAIEGMQEKAANIETNQTPGSRALKYVGILRDCINEIFDNPDAADAIFADENRLTGFNQRFNDMSYHIGAMRGAAFNAATQALVASNAARVLNPDNPTVEGVKPALRPLPKPGAHTPPRNPSGKRK